MKLKHLLYFVPGIIFAILGWQFAAGLAFGLPIYIFKGRNDSEPI